MHASALKAIQLDRPAVRTLPASGAAALIAETDGTLLPHVEFAPGAGDRRRLRKVAYREVRLLAAQAAGETAVSYAVSFGALAETGTQWQQAALQAGWASPTYIHPVGDGAAWVADLARTCFGPPGRFLLDLCHVGGYIAAAAPAEQPDYLRRQKAALCAGQSDALIAELAARLEPPATPEAEAPVRAAHRYLSNRRDQLDYPGALARLLPIGSGLIESGHRHILQKRLKIPGAAWLRPNAEAIAHARALRANGGWLTYWSSLDQARN